MNALEIIEKVSRLTKEYDSATILRFLPAFEYAVEYGDFEKVYIQIESRKCERRRFTNVKHPTYSFDRMYNTIIKYKECNQVFFDHYHSSNHEICMTISYEKNLIDCVSSKLSIPPMLGKLYDLK